MKLAPPLLLLGACLSLLLLLAASPTARAAPVFDKELQLDHSLNEGSYRRVRTAVTPATLASGQSSPTRLFYSPLVVCATNGCVKATDKDGKDLGTACAPACASVGGGGSRGKPFRLTATGGKSASFLEIATTWPDNPISKNA
jgi:hypothetical protein